MIRDHLLEFIRIKSKILVLFKDFHLIIFEVKFLLLVKYEVTLKYFSFISIKMHLAIIKLGRSCNTVFFILIGRSMNLGILIIFEYLFLIEFLLRV